MDLDVRKHLLPEFGDEVIDDGGIDKACVHHLEDVVVLEGLWRFLDGHSRLSASRKRLIQFQQTFVIGAASTNENFAA